VRELRPGLWHWQAPHPDWDKEKWWPELVSSYGIELGDDFVLFDPLAVPDELRERATAVVLTAPYHERDARRLGLPVHTPPADTWQDWVEKFGIDPDRVRGMESEDLAWLRAGEGEGHFHGPGAWPFGITAYAGREDNDLILWLPSINAIVTAGSRRRANQRAPSAAASVAAIARSGCTPSATPAIASPRDDSPSRRRPKATIAAGKRIRLGCSVSPATTIHRDAPATRVPKHATANSSSPIAIVVAPAATRLRILMARGSAAMTKPSASAPRLISRQRRGAPATWR
jgi:hypothetical protein